MRVVYVNIGNSHYKNISSFELEQRATLPYKICLASEVPVTYFLRGDCDFQKIYGNLFVRCLALSVPSFLMLVIGAVRKEKVNAIIIHGIHNFPVGTILKLMTGCAVILQHHGEHVFKSRLKCTAMSLMTGYLDGFFFNGADVAKEFTDRNCLPPQKIYEVTEGTSNFISAEPGTKDSPRIIFIGRLDENKDPLSLLRALQLLNDIPFNAVLVYSTGQLEPVLTEFILNAGMQKKTMLKGKVNSANIQEELNAADIFVSCSWKEGSGYALIEALACGVYPIVTAIPSFNYLLGGLDFKEQYKPGDHETLSIILREVLNSKRFQNTRETVRKHFENRASAAAIASQIKTALNKIIP